MSIKIKFLAAFMAFCTMFGAFAVLSALPVFAEETSSTDTTAPGESGEDETIDYLKHVFATKEEKLATMKLVYSRFEYELYYESYTGEVAVKNTNTGDILFTNPYDIGGAKASENIKNQLLSQIVLEYSTNTGDKVAMYSYVESALRGHIKIKNVKNGIRVEYLMGKQESRILVPRQIEKNRFETQILANITNSSRKNFVIALYVEKNPNDPTNTSQAIAEMKKAYPITNKYAIYVFDSNASEREKNVTEQIIKEFCPDYTYEELDYDHNLVEYVNVDKNPVQFRLALEYYLDESGLSVRLPANGIRFDQSTYQLEYIRILPYMGAASSDFTGYTMIPDGSGTLVRFEDVLESGASRTLRGALYGADYAYHNITGANQQVMRMPIFGLVENAVYKEPIIKDEVTSGLFESESETVAPDSESAVDGSDDTSADTSVKEEEVIEYNTYRRDTGYVAIIEEGDALASIISEHGGNKTHKYNSVYTEFNPRPKDQYSLPTSISVGGNATWTVVSERKYTGSYRIRYIMLSDMEYAAENGIDATNCYDTSYVGMALAYRNRLITEGKIEKLANDKTQIPFYIETLGVMDVQDKFLSMPITVKKALTTFEDIKTITGELAEAGITNLVYKLTGYVNGGIVNTITSKLNVEKAAGNEDGLKDLIEFAKEKGIEVYLDIDFSYAEEDKLFDGFSKKDDAVMTIDGRYTQKRTYSATLQYFTSTGLLAVSPSVFTDIFKSAKKDLNKLGIGGVSVGTLGSDLNSDFDEDEPYNREDSKKHVVETLGAIREAGYKVMLDGGNAYAIAYADHILNVALDSSNYTYASEAVPMFGLVYHGYLNYAGTPTNMAGDMRYEMLKILENGSNPYFILAYRNTEKLKEDSELSKYFSISYSTWKGDLIAAYNKLNNALSSVLGSAIVNHEFVIGERIPTSDELAADAEAERLEKEEQERLEEESRLEEERQENLKDHLDSKKEETADTEETLDTEISEDTELPEDSETESEDGEVTTESDTETKVEEPEVPEIPEIENDYPYTKYTSDNGMIVKVTFENGYSFILNYNIFDVTVAEFAGVKISSLGYIVIDSDGKVVINSGKEA